MILLQKGTKSPLVIEWQYLISVEQDGIFGEITEKHTKAWQKRNAFEVTGEVTRPMLAAAIGNEIINIVKSSNKIDQIIKKINRVLP